MPITKTVLLQLLALLAAAWIYGYVTANTPLGLLVHAPQTEATAPGTAAGYHAASPAGGQMPGGSAEWVAELPALARP